MRKLALVACLQLVGSSLFAAPGDLTATIPNPTPEVDAEFGAALSDTGLVDRVAIGAPGASGGHGRVSIVTYSGTFLQSIHSPLGTLPPHARFGFSLAPAINGFVAGAPSAANGGRAILFEGEGYTPTGYSAPPGGETGFGTSVAFSSFGQERIILGSPSESDYGRVIWRKRSAPLTTGNLEHPQSPNAEFGASMAVSPAGSFLVVGAPGDESPYAGGRVYPYPTNRFEYDPYSLNPIRVSGGQPGDRFGASVSLSDDVNILVGAPNVGSGVGRAYVCSAYSSSKTLINPPPGGGGEFGFSVYTTDRLRIVGAPGYATQVGRAYVYDIPTNHLILTLENPNPVPGDRFGASVRIVNSQFFVGAPGKDVGASNAGVVYLFQGAVPPPILAAASAGSTSIRLSWSAKTENVSQFQLERAPAGSNSFTVVDNIPVSSREYLDEGLATNTSYCYRIRPVSGTIVVYSNTVCASTEQGPIPQLITSINNPDAGAFSNFGAVVTAVGKKRFAVAAPGPSTAGHVYIYNSKGEFERRLSNPRMGAYSGDGFGTALGSIGDDLLVGAPGAETTYSGGRVYRFETSTGNLLDTYSIPLPSPGVNERFGASVAGFGKSIIVGAPRSSLAAPTAGAVFLLSSQNGELQEVVFEPHLNSGNQFGSAAAAGKRNFFGISWFSAPVGGNSGTVYGFDRRGSGIGYGNQGYAVAGAGANALVGALGNNAVSQTPSTNDYGFAYLFSGSTIRRIYMNPASRGRDLFGFAVAGDTNVGLVGAPGWDGPGESTGRAYLLDQKNGDLLQSFENPEPDAQDRFGHSVALFGRKISIIGAPYDDTNALDAGSVYLFSNVSAKGNKLKKR